MNNIPEIFDCLKCKHPDDTMQTFFIRNDEAEIVAYLKPIVKDFRITDPYLGELMSKWRIENPTISTGNFEVTTERTIKWLDNLVINREDRLIFIITDLAHKPMGHIGYSNLDAATESIELDSVLRGVKGTMPGLMKYCTKKLITWGYTHLGLKDIELSVYSDNESAVRFYENVGFITTKKLPLMKVQLENEEKFELASEDYTGPVEKYYLKMKFIQ